MQPTTLRPILAGFCFALPSLAGAGTYLENTHTTLDAKQKPTVHKMWFDAGRLRTESEGHAVLLKDQSLYILDQDDKTYRVLDTATLQRMGGKIAEARKKMEAQMANLPPERRAMVEKMMGKAGAGAQQPDREAGATNRTETVAGRTCKIWEITANGAKEEELCVVPPSSLPGGDEMLRTLRELSERFKSVTQNLGSWRGKTFTPWGDLAKIDGVPVLSRDFENGKPVSETRLSAIRSEAMPASLFEVPPGYKKNDMGL